MSGLLEQVRKKRNLPFLRRGMAVDVNGRMGTLTNGNAHGNIQVRFGGEHFSRNCHPTWQTTYFQDGNVVADYKQSAENGNRQTTHAATKETC